MRVSVLGDVSSWLPTFGEWFRYMKFKKSLIYASLFNGKCLSGTYGDDSARKSVQPSRGLQMLASRIGMSARPMPSSLAVKQELWVYMGLFFVHFELLKYGSVFLSSFLGCFLELWQRRTAPYGTHRQGKYGAHWCQPRLPRSQILDWNQWFTQTTSHVFKLRFANYQIDILESKSRRVIAFLPYLILYHLCLVCPVRVLGQKTATGWQ